MRLVAKPYGERCEWLSQEVEGIEGVNRDKVEERRGIKP